MPRRRAARPVRPICTSWRHWPSSVERGNSLRMTLCGEGRRHRSQDRLGGDSKESTSPLPSWSPLPVSFTWSPNDRAKAPIQSRPDSQPAIRAGRRRPRHLEETPCWTKKRAQWATLVANGLPAERRGRRPRPSPAAWLDGRCPRSFPSRPQPPGLARCSPAHPRPKARALLR